MLYSCHRCPGFAVIFFWGRFLLPIPFRVPILCVIGKPIDVDVCDNPTDEQVNTVHQSLMDEMVKLFDKHKASYGWAHKQLVIV